MLLVLAFTLLIGAFIVLYAALVKDTGPTGLERALQALEQSGHTTADVDQRADLSFADRILVPLQGRALALARRFSGADKSERIRHRLDLAGNPRNWSVDRVLSLKVIAAIAVPVIGLAYGLLLGVSLTWILAIGIGGLILGFFAPDIYLYQAAEKRADQIKKSLADSVDLLTISVEAGLGFDAALQQVARNTEGPLAEEFARALREMQLGKGRSEALKGLTQRSDVEDLHGFVTSMVQADAFGISVGQVLRVQSAEIRLKRRQYAEEKAQQVPVKIMIPLILFILPCLFVVVMGPAALNAIDSFNN